MIQKHLVSFSCSCVTMLSTYNEKITTLETISELIQFRFLLISHSNQLLKKTWWDEIFHHYLSLDFFNHWFNQQPFFLKSFFCIDGSNKKSVNIKNNRKITYMFIVYTGYLCYIRNLTIRRLEKIGWSRFINISILLWYIRKLGETFFNTML